MAMFRNLFSWRRFKTHARYSRGRFENNPNFLVSLCAASIGLGDVLRFPAFAIKQRDGTFVIPFLLYMMFVGSALVTMELFLGQFTSSGPIDCWKFSPIFRGVGFSSMFFASMLLLFYQVDVALTAFYIFKSFAVTLPWKYCDREWATDFCLDFLNTSSVEFCRDQGWNVSSDGACYNDGVTPGQIKSLWNITLAAENEIRRVVPAYDYFNHYVLGIHKPGISLFSLGSLNLKLFGCLVFVWVIITLALWWGLKSIMRILNVTVFYIFVALTVQFAVVLNMDGAVDGLKSFVRIDFQSLSRIGAWLDAIDLTVFTLAINAGILLTLASFHDVRGDCCAYGAVMVAGNIVTSFLSGCITFGVIGSVSKLFDVSLSLCGEADEIGFIVYPHALASFSGGAFWSVGFFFMVFFAGLSTMIAIVNAVYSFILDLFPVLRPFKQIVLLTIGIVYCLLGLPLVTDGGPHLLSILKTAVSSFDVLLLAFLQCISLAWVYGIRNLLYDISFIIGDKAFGILPWKFVKYVYALSWTVFCPLVTAISIVASLRKAIVGAGTLQGAVKLTISCIIVLPVPILAVKALFNKKNTAIQKLRSAYQPTEGWGPVVPKIRSKWLAGTKISIPASRNDDSEISGEDVVDDSISEEILSKNDIKINVDSRSSPLADANTHDIIMEPHPSPDLAIPVTEPQPSSDVPVTEPQPSTDVPVTEPQSSTDGPVRETQ